MSTLLSLFYTPEKERSEFFRTLNEILDSGLVDHSEVSLHLNKHYAELEAVTGGSADHE